MHAPHSTLAPDHSQTKLILLEGMPGTGKSSVSQAIHRNLVAKGMSSRWLHEEADHSLRVLFDPGRHIPWRAYLAEVMDKWKSFSTEVSNGNAVFVVDSALLQNHIRSLLIFDVDREAVFEVARAIEDIVADLFPKWVYLAPTNLSTHFDNITAIRGQRMMDLWIEAHDQYPFAKNARLSGEAGFIAFWRQFDTIATSVFHNLRQSKLQLKVDAGSRGETLSSVRVFLGLSAETKPMSPSVLESFAGFYAATRDADHRTMEIVAADGCLFALTESPTINVAGGPLGCFHQIRLVPVTPTLYCVEGWPYEVRFEKTSDGATLLRLFPTEDAWNPSSKTYLKL